MPVIDAAAFVQHHAVGDIRLGKEDEGPLGGGDVGRCPTMGQRRYKQVVVQRSHCQNRRDVGLIILAGPQHADHSVHQSGGIYVFA